MLYVQVFERRQTIFSFFKLKKKSHFNEKLLILKKRCRIFCIHIQYSQTMLLSMGSIILVRISRVHVQDVFELTGKIKLANSYCQPTIIFFFFSLQQSFKTEKYLLVNVTHPRKRLIRVWNNEIWLYPCGCGYYRNNVI